MKRFFKPVDKNNNTSSTNDGSFKKPKNLVSSSCSSADEEKQAPRSQPQEQHQQHQEDDGGNNINEWEAKKKREPLKFLTWNANSLLLRVKNNWPEFSKFIETIDPDVIAIQEVRMPAAGSKGGPKNPRELKDDNNSSREEKLILTRALSSPTFRNYSIWWSLSDSKYAGTALLVKKCFQPKKVSFSLDHAASKHEADGRVILAEFESFRLLNTYVPNNGWKDEETSFQRRRKWDKRMKDFVLHNSDKPLIWCGDLNVSHEDIDVSHPDFFSAAKLNGYTPPNKEDCGQPGFTLAERRRFGSIMKEGKLIDAYRFLHKDKDMERGFSWSGNPVGKYRGKRMRIDYFIVSESLKDRIVSCEMHGHGIELEGFYGSDHCPVSLQLSEASLDNTEKQAPTNGS